MWVSTDHNSKMNYLYQITALPCSWLGFPVGLIKRSTQSLQRTGLYMYSSSDQPDFFLNQDGYFTWLSLIVNVI